VRPPRLRALIVGAGARVQETVLPAFACLADRFELAGIYSRTLLSARKIGAAWQVRASDDLGEFDFREIHLVVVAVTTRSVPQVVRALTAFDLSQTVVMLDTPVLPSLNSLGSLVRLGRCKAALVSEDCIALPQVVLCRALIAQGRIGRLRRIWLFHSGYRYHAVAILRALLGGGYFRSVRTSRYAGDCAEVTLRSACGVIASIVEPRDYPSGRLLVAGDAGLISDYRLCHPNASRIEYLYGKDGRYAGLALDGVPVPHDALDLRFFEHLPAGVRARGGVMGYLKIRALMTLLDAVVTGESRYRYPLRAGLYDSILSLVWTRTPLWLDPMALFGSSVIDLALLRALPRVLRGIEWLE